MKFCNYLISLFIILNLDSFFFFLLSYTSIIWFFISDFTFMLFLSFKIKLFKRFFIILLYLNYFKLYHYSTSITFFDFLKINFVILFDVNSKKI